MAGSGLAAGLSRLTRDHREWALTGLITEIRRSTGEAPVLVVELTDGRPIEARPAYAPGDYTPHTVGDEVAVLLDSGETGGAIALARPVGGQQMPPDEVDDAGRYMFAAKVEVRSATGQGVDGVVLRALLDDLATVTTDLQALVAAIAAGTPGTTVNNSTMLAAMKATTTSLAASLTTLQAGLTSSKAGSGAAPYCSPVLRATDGT